MMNKLLILVIVAIISFGVYNFMGKKNGSSSAPATLNIQAQVNLPPLPPRTTAPMAEFTKLFTKKKFTPVETPQARALTYYFFQPKPPYPAGLKFPVILLLHGTPGNVYAAPYLISSKNQLNYPAFVIVPVLPAGDTWMMPKALPSKWRPAMRETVELVKTVMKEYPVDTSRVYVVGCSEGGFGTMAALRDYGDIFTAGASFSGGWDTSDSAKFLNKPLLMIHGGQDTMVPTKLSRDIANAIMQAGGRKIVYNEPPEMGHECSSPVLYGDFLWKWLFAQKKQAPAKAAP